MAPLSPSVTVASPTESAGTPSSSTIVAVPRPAEVGMAAFVAPDRLTVKVSSLSSAVSPVTGTAMVAICCPGLNVSVPAVAEKSPGATAAVSRVAVSRVAAPGAAVSPVAKSTVTGRPLGSDRLTAKAAVVAPASPSVTRASPIDRRGAPSASAIVAVPARSA